MNFKDVYKTLQMHKFFVFSFDDLLLFYPDETRENMKKLMYRWRQKGWIRTLKRGLYELAFPDTFNIPDMHVANRLYQPSYVSLETALSHYSIIPEVSLAVTSITTKPTRRFHNSHGLFTYRTVKPAAYTGYYIETIRGFDVLIAEPEKAIVDYFYFVTLRKKKKKLTYERLDMKRMQALHKNRMKKYAKLFGIDMRSIYVDV